MSDLKPIRNPDERFILGSVLAKHYKIQRDLHRNYDDRWRRDQCIAKCELLVSMALDELGWTEDQLKKQSGFK
jgi:hypothetical protein